MATTVGTEATARTGRSGEETAILASRVALGGLAAVFAVLLATGMVPSIEVQMLLYLVGMVALNLPHGGFEHFTNVRRRGLPFGGRYIALYLAFVAAFVGLFFVAPVLGLGLAFATAVAKGGHGDLRVMDALTGTSHLRSRAQRVLAGVVRGAPVMVVPMVFWPETFQQFGAVMVRIFDPAAVGQLELGMTVGPPVLGSLLAVAVVAHLALGLRAEGASAAWRRDAAEIGLLLAFFAVVPVVVAVGMYFPLWYSLRQSARSAVAERALGEPAPEPAGQVARARQRVHDAQVAVPTLGDRGGEGQAEPHHRGHEQQPDERGDEPEVQRDVAPAKGQAAAPHVGEVLEAAVGEVQRHHPDQVHQHLDLERGHCVHQQQQQPEGRCQGTQQHA